MKVVLKFKNDVTMAKWVADDKNIDELKKQYPPKKYGAKLNLTKREVCINER